MRVLITGSEGYVGRALTAELVKRGDTVIGHDIEHDITRPDWFHDALAAEPEAIFHLAAHKYATSAEEIPAAVAKLNIEGTSNVVWVAEDLGIPLVFASTCKAADPCTVYGASKLIGERIVRNANKHVLRFVNIMDSVGSVIRIWKDLPDDEPLPVCDATRMWMTEQQAVEALIATMEEEPGVYGPVVSAPGSVSRMAKAWFPGRKQVRIPLRRGDRANERLAGEYEQGIRINDKLVRIVGPWD